MSDFTISGLTSRPGFENLLNLLNADKVDTDNNGILSNDELLHWNIGGYDRGPNSRDVDFNGDGQVTLEELAVAAQFANGSSTFTMAQIQEAFKAAGLPEPTMDQINLCKQRNPDGSYNQMGAIDPARVAFMISKNPDDKMRLLTPPPPANIDFTNFGTQVDLKTIAGISPELAKVLGAADGDLLPGDNFLTPATLKKFMEGSPFDRAALLKTALKRGEDQNPPIALPLKPDDLKTQLNLSDQQIAHFFGTPPVINSANMQKLADFLDPTKLADSKLAGLVEAPGSLPPPNKLYTNDSVAGLVGPEVALLLDGLDGHNDGVVRDNLLQKYLSAKTPEEKVQVLLNPGPGFSPRELSPDQLEKIGLHLPPEVLQLMKKNPTDPSSASLDSKKLGAYLSLNKGASSIDGPASGQRLDILKAFFPQGFNPDGTIIPGQVIPTANLGSLLGLPPDVVKAIDGCDIAGNNGFITDGNTTMAAVMGVISGTPAQRLDYLAKKPDGGEDRPISRDAAEWIIGRRLSETEFQALKDANGMIIPSKLKAALASSSNPTTTNTTTTTTTTGGATGGVAPTGTAASIVLPAGARNGAINNTYLANAGFFTGTGGKTTLPNFLDPTKPLTFPLTQDALKTAGYLSFSGDDSGGSPTVDEFEVAMQALATKDPSGKPVTITEANLKVLLHLPPDHTFTPEELACLKGTPPAANGDELSLSAVAKMYDGTPSEKSGLLELSKNQPGFNVTKTLAQAFGLSEANVNKVMAIPETDKAGRLAKLEELLRNPNAP